MELFTIDKDKCISCGVCARVCPALIINFNKADKYPRLVPGQEERCINCGHCVAVCPKAAFSLATMPAASCETIAKDWRVAPEELRTFLKARRSIRVYKDKSLTKDDIDALVDTARYSPSGINLQPVHWACIYEKEKVHELARLTVEWMRALVAAKNPMAEAFGFELIISAWDEGKDRVARGAPHIVIAYGLKEDPTARDASTIALTYFELAAYSKGFGVCWAGYIHMAINMFPDARKLVGISSRADCTGAMMLGFPEFEYHRIPLRNTAKILWR